MELMGIADPAPVSELFDDEELKKHFVLDGIITVVDSKHFLPHLIKTENAIKNADNETVIKNEALAQVAVADIILLNKVDLVSELEITALSAKIKSLNGFAKVLTTQNSTIPYNEVLNLGGSNIFALDIFGQNQSSTHDITLQFFAIYLDKPAVDLEKLHSFFKELQNNNTIELLRIKGLILVPGKPNLLFVQGVHKSISITETATEASEKYHSRIAFIGRHLDKEEIKQKLNAITI